MSESSAESVYREFHRNLLTQFILATQQQPPFIQEECDEDALEYLSQLEALPSLQGSDYIEQGQRLLTRTIASFAHLTPLLPRDLLWHFGGDCLHYMPDEEIEKFQQLDEQLHQAIEDNQPFDYATERARLLGLH
ncbi:PA2817 family protein [Gilvimarinus sp. SDUM040013]|uniref:PA2817 family protein n=1 Tax=Gilvimarinus gilvus TaxID=3058038 RepID=A0ABU4S6I0_9GAMM|nr:PA2817 family protein [Gilvimarinus sp. SDUM040013]MDO3384335.1 PA2817 family protein [Gilvimarinus sp. SDUM040013]MDX6851513.1 PA2817 family protein [Gilvimarinus sp. SDUM040013]